MSHLRQHFLQHVAQTSPGPLSIEVESASGIYIHSPDGKSYLDLIAGIGVSSLGHCHPAVVEAVQHQASKYLHTMVYGEYLMTPQIQLSQMLASLLPDPLDCVYLLNSGTEACEGAMKLAKRYTGRYQFVAAKNAYHGGTHGAASLMLPTTFTQAFFPMLPGIRHLIYNDFESLEVIDCRTAAVVLETVQAESGIHKPNPTWIQAVRQRCTEVGALLILDEIQAGYGRTGTLWAFEQYDIVPDILLLAKGMGGGMPIGAFIASQQMMSVLTHNPVLGHINTFGGHAVSCAAALATLKTLTEGTLIAEVQAKEAHFLQKLQHPRILEIRSAGLWMAVDLGSFENVLMTIKGCLEEGLITDWFLFNDQCLRIAPPLTITHEEIDIACDILLRSLDF